MDKKRNGRLSEKIFRGIIWMQKHVKKGKGW